MLSNKSSSLSVSLPLSLPPSLVPHDSLFTLLVVIWPYEINRPSSLLLRPHREEGEEEEGETTHTLGPTITWVACILFFFFFFLVAVNLFICLFFNWQRRDDAGGGGHLRPLLQRPAGGVGLN